MPAGIAARTRYIDDIVRQEAAKGVRQVVILGAGLDMRAFRMEELKGIPVFEVDFPATQALKLSKLGALDLPQRPHLRHVPIDFNRDSLSDTLAQAGYQAQLPSLFLWEGVTMYLDAASVDATLSFIATNRAAGTSVYFDYLLQSALDGRSDLPEARNVSRTGSFGGRGAERYTFGIEDGTINEFLVQRGFQLVEHMTGESLKERYFHGENSSRYVFRICGFVHARPAG